MGVYEKKCTSRGGSIKMKLMESQGGLRKKAIKFLLSAGFEKIQKLFAWEKIAFSIFSSGPKDH